MGLTMNDRIKMKITDSFEDGAAVHKRSSSDDFSTIVYRTNEKVRAIIGGNDEAAKLINEGCYYYDRGDYSDAQRNFSWCLNKYPQLNEHFFYYLRICQRVLNTPLLHEEKVYAEKFKCYRNASKLRKWLLTKPDVKARCKWCGRYTEFIPPNVPTHGTSLLTFGLNNCRLCGRMYPMPSWEWDSPDGRAYNYYRMSFGNSKDDIKFYEEFESDYEPVPKNSLFKEQKNEDTQNPLLPNKKKEIDSTAFALGTNKAGASAKIVPSLYARPGESINIVIQTLGNDGKPINEDGYAPVIESFYFPDLSKAEDYPHSMEELDTDLFYHTVHFSSDIVGTYIASIYWNTQKGESVYETVAIHVQRK